MDKSLLERRKKGEKKKVCSTIYGSSVGTPGLGMASIVGILHAR
jgi:hypothetical protein